MISVRRALAAFVISAGTACGSFSADPAPVPLVPPVVEAGIDGAIGEEDTGAPPVPDAEAPDSGIQPPLVGASCAGRKPPWIECFDFEIALTSPPSGDGNGTVKIENNKGTDGSRALRAELKENKAGSAFQAFDVSPLAHRVAWAFDVHVDSALLQGTQFGALLLPLEPSDAGDNFCTLQIARPSMIAITVQPYCTLAGLEREYPAMIILPVAQSDDEWVNLFVAVDFDTKVVRAALRKSNGTLTERTGAIDEHPKLFDKPKLQLGIVSGPSTKPATRVDVDNFAAWWDGP